MSRHLRAATLLVMLGFAATAACKKEEPKEETSKESEKAEKKEKKKASDDEDEGKDKKAKKKKGDSAACPTSFSAFKDHDTADEQSCTCDEEHIGGAVWGSELYTEDSSPCAAAVHAGVIKKAGGDITMKHTKGCDVYTGSTKNGVTSHGWGKFDGSFYFPDKGDGKCKKSDVCPSTFASIKDKDEDTEITCSCAANPSGSVWGNGIYTQDSSLCKAAQQAGEIAKDGGSITAKAAPGCKSYQAGTANGITSSSWGEYQTSFYFPAHGDGICKTPKVVTGGKYAVGQGVDVLWNGSWYDASVTAVAPADKYRVHYTGYAASWDEWVTLSRMRPRTGKALKK